MNNQDIIDLPLLPTSQQSACSVAYAEGLIQDAIAAPTTNIDMSILHKVTGLPVATNPSDAVRFD